MFLTPVLQRIRRSNGTQSFGMGSDQDVPLTGMFVVLSYRLMEKRLRGNALENQLQSS